MTGQLQVKAGVRCCRCRARLMRQQDPDCGTLGRPGNCRHRIAAMGLVEVMAAVVGHAGQHDLRIPVFQ